MRYFDIVAFGNEFTGKRFARVRKWVDPIRIGLQGKYPEYFELFVLQQILDLQQLTNHRIELYYSPTLQRKKLLPSDFDQKKTNVILFYLPRDKISDAVTKYFGNDPAQVAAIVKSSTCFAKFFTRRDEIRAAIAVFPAEHPKDFMRACVVEELTQILGLPNDSATVEASIFNDHSQYLSLRRTTACSCRYSTTRELPSPCRGSKPCVSPARSHWSEARSSSTCQTASDPPFKN